MAAESASRDLSALIHPRLNSFRAQEFLTAASGLAVAGQLKLKDAVTVVKDYDGSTVVHETIDPSPGRSALSGRRRFQSGCGVLDEEG